MPDTPNHEYNAPKEGKKNWHDPINKNWEALDTDVEIRDADANLSEYAPKDGAKFLATDTGDVYVGDGNEWDPLGSVRSSSSSNSDAVEIVARDASEIQPAIDAISGERVEGNIVGGTVRLLPKAYYPTDTIWLKRGVVLKGSREWPQSVNPSVGAYSDVDSTQATTLYTSELPEGPAWSIRPENGTHTFRHFNEPSDFDYYRNNDPDKDSEEQWWHDHTHPHLPVVSAYTKQPIYYEDPLTEDHKRYWGDGVAMANIKIHADQKRYWDPANEPSGSQREKHATYFGVYDGFLFEDLEYLHLSNVEVTGFDGYTAFYQDIQEVVSRGNHYSGTATDHHGSALVLTRANSGSNRYMRGIWDVKVSGPTPTVQVDNHAVRSKFVSGANIKNTIAGEETRFLDESMYDAGDAPIVDKERKHDIVTQKDGFVTWDGYQIEGPGGVSNYNKVGYRATDSNIRMRNMRFRRTKTGIHGVSQSGISVSDTSINASDHCVYLSGGYQGSWHNCWFNEAANGVTFQGRENADGAWVDVKFSTDKAINSGPNSRHAAHFIRPNLSGSGSVDNPENCVIVSPQGYKNSHRQTDEFSTDGSKTSFSVEHGMDETPVHAVASPTNGAAQSNWPVIWSADETTLSFQFASAPSSDPELSWVAQGASHPDHNKQG